MFFTCECGKIVYYLDDECPYCGRKIVQPEAEDEHLQLLSSKADNQLRLFSADDYRL